MYKITSFFKYKISFFIFLLSYLMIPNVGFSAAAAAAAEDRVFDSVLETPSRKIRVISEIAGKRVYEDVQYLREHPIRFIHKESWPDYGLSFDKYFFRGMTGHSPLGGYHPDGTEGPIGTIYYNEEIGVVVAFCGSKPGLSLVQMLDDSTWLTDFDFSLTDADAYFPRGVFTRSRGQIHSGFAKVIRDCRSGLNSALTRLLKDHPEKKDEPGTGARNKSFYVTGHSLGGALSKFGALSLINIGKGLKAEPLNFRENQLKVVSFSSPRIGNRAFYEFFEETLHKKNILEFICQGDIVTRVPVGGEYEFGTLPPGHFIPIYSADIIIEKYIEDLREKGVWERVFLALDVLKNPLFIINPGDLFSKLHSISSRLTEGAYLDYKEKHRWDNHKALLKKLGRRPWGDE